MSRYILAVMVNAVEGRDAELNEWYPRHLSDVTALPPFVGAQRFKLAQTSPAQAGEHRYLTLYDVETDDLDAAHKLLASVLNTDAMPLTDALDEANVKGWYFEPIPTAAEQR